VKPLHEVDLLELLELELALPRLPVLHRILWRFLVASEFVLPPLFCCRQELPLELPVGHRQARARKPSVPPNEDHTEEPTANCCEPGANHLFMFARNETVSRQYAVGPESSEADK